MTKTKPQSPECSVTIAFAELGRLERERAEFAANKQSAREQLARQARDLANLRERFEAERPRALDRLRRERQRRERFREQLAARLIAEAESAHDERLALIRAELEAKRLRLAALEVSSAVPAPRRRWLEWSIPVAATAMVAFLGMTLLDEEQAVAQPAAVEVVEQREAVEPEIEDEAPAPEPVAESKPEPKPEEPKPEEPKPEPSKKKSTKSKSTKSKKSEEQPKTESKPVIKKNSKPLEIGDFDGNPLG